MGGEGLIARGRVKGLIARGRVNFALGQVKMEV